MPSVSILSSAASSSASFIAHFIGKFYFLLFPRRETEAGGKTLSPTLDATVFWFCFFFFLAGEEEEEGFPQPPAASHGGREYPGRLVGHHLTCGRDGRVEMAQTAQSAGINITRLVGAAGLAPPGESRNPLSLKNCLGETGRDPPLPFPAARPGEGSWGWPRIPPALPQPPPAPFAASQQLLKAEEKKRKGLKSTLKKAGQGEEPEFPAAPSPPAAAAAAASFVCRL